MKSESIRRVVLGLAAAVCAASPWLVLAESGEALEIGWSEADITPPTTKRIPLCGQYYQRLADKDNPYHSRLKFVALALKQGNEYVLMGSIDNVTTWTPFVERVRARVKAGGNGKGRIRPIYLHWTFPIFHQGARYDAI